MAAKRIDSMRDMAFKGDALPLAIVTKTNNELVGWVTLIRDAERMLYAPARARNELCRFYEIERSDAVHAD